MKKARLDQTGFCFAAIRSLGALDVGSLLALGALHDIEGNFLTFLQRLETIHVDGGEMSEEVFAAIIRSDKAKTLGIIKPLDGANCHVCYFHTINEQISGSPVSLFELNDPVLAATSMQLESKHDCFLRQTNYCVNIFQCCSATLLEDRI